MASPILFRNSDTGGARISSTKGDLTTLLSECLILKRCTTTVSASSTTDGSSASDNSAEARLVGGTPFNCFQTSSGQGAQNDTINFMLQAKFDRVRITLSALGTVPPTLAFEYWNGTTYAAVSGLVDGTTNLTASGNITFTIPGDWASKTFNSVTGCFVFRIRISSVGAFTVAPTIDHATITGWTAPFATVSNECAYQQGGGNQMYVNVNDNGPGTGAAKNARVRGYETMTALNTGTGPFPSVAQATNGLFPRKSTATDPDTTARTWVMIADDRTFYLGMQSGDNVAGSGSTSYQHFWFGDLFSLAGSGDAYRTFIVAPLGTEGTADTNGAGLCSVGVNATNGHYIARVASGAAGALQVGKFGNASFGASLTSLINAMLVSATDGSYIFAPFWITDGSPRGRLRGIWHSAVSITDGNTISGVGTLSSKTLVISGPVANPTDSSGKIAFETSDTWETN